jgi:hypothetical protein
MQRPAAPVPIVAGLGDFAAGSILLPAPPQPPMPAAAPLRSRQEAGAGTPLISACAALAVHWLSASLETRWIEYTAPQQELLLMPTIRFESPASSLGLSLAGLRLSASFNRTTVASKHGSQPQLSPVGEISVACYSGGGVPAGRDQAAPLDMCAQYNLSTFVTDAGVELLFRSGTLAPFHTIDLGVDAAIASLWHSAWNAFVNGTVKSNPTKATCEPSLLV